MKTPQPSTLDRERIQALMAACPSVTASGGAMAVGLCAAILFSAGYVVGKEMALTDNRADHQRRDR